MLPSTPITTLLRLRLEAGLSQLQVARRVPINRKTLKALEQGKTAQPQTPSISRLAAFYGVRPDWLLREYHRDRHEAGYERAA